ncbi:MAG: Holliday junction DNA helicase RuvA [Phycisphaerales bacterium]|jgi:Holliday junction DNA helicase RuvA
MIRAITGKLSAIDPGPPAAALIVPPGSGLTYEVLLPGYLSARLASQVGNTIELQTRNQLETVGNGSSFIPRLIGFGSPLERAFFERFTAVKGLGTKKALKALVVEPPAVAAAICRRDAKELTALPEIGKRLAETIIAELHGKIDGFLSEHQTASLNAGAIGAIEHKSRPKAAMEAIATLQALGDVKAEAERKVDAILAAQPDLAGADSADAIVAAAFGQ